MNAAKISILYVTPSLLVSSMADLLRKKGHEVTVCKLDVKEVSRILEPQDAMLIFADEGTSDNTEALVYVKDRASENDTAIFVAGDDIELNNLKKVIPSTLISASFSRPVNVKEVVDTIDLYAIDENRLSKKKILVVDDSGAMLRNVKGWLGDKYQVALANSGAMAIKYLSLDKPDLVLLDYEMPVVDGRQVLEMIKSEMDFSDIPVIFLTSKSDRQSVVEVMSLKPEGYLLKTMSPSEIVKAVDDFFVRQKMSKMS